MTRHGERAQSLVEAVAIVPLCMVCALALVDAGLLVRDRVATVQATTRAASAAMADGEIEAAALGALPEALRSEAEVRVDGDEVVVSTTSHLTLLRVPGGVDHRSTAQLDDEGDGGSR